MTNKDYEQLNKRHRPFQELYQHPLRFSHRRNHLHLGRVFEQYLPGDGNGAGYRRAVVSVTLVFLSALLTGLKIYDKIAKHGGAVTLVPITGFANAVVSPALEFKSEGMILGLGAKMFVIAGPVIVYGISASIVYGIIIFLFKLY